MGLPVQAWPSNAPLVVAHSGELIPTWALLSLWSAAKFPGKSCSTALPPELCRAPFWPGKGILPDLGLDHGHTEASAWGCGRTQSKTMEKGPQDPAPHPLALVLVPPPPECSSCNGCSQGCRKKQRFPDLEQGSGEGTNRSVCGNQCWGHRGHSELGLESCLSLGSLPHAATGKRTPIPHQWG